MLPLLIPVALGVFCTLLSGLKLHSVYLQNIPFIGESPNIIGGVEMGGYPG